MINRKQAQELSLKNQSIKEKGIDHVRFLDDVITKSAEKGLTSVSLEMHLEDFNDIKNYLLSHGFDVEYSPKYEEQSSVIIIAHWN